MEQPNIVTSESADIVTSEPADNVTSEPAGVAASEPAVASGRANRRRVKQGRVKSDKMDKTIVVLTETRVPHPVYKKVVRQSTRFKAHDEKNEAKAGDLVRIQECRPMSRDKRWRLVEILERAR
jgi:small subunit ribosomal protein S17